MLSNYRKLLWIVVVLETPAMISSLGASDAVLCLNMLHAIQVNLFANTIASLLRYIRSDARVSHAPKLSPATGGAASG